MKKIFVSALSGLVIAANAFAGPIVNSPIGDLNSEIERLLAPYQSESTNAQLKFSSIQTDAVRTMELALNASYKKIGTQNTLDINFGDISYNYGNGTAPLTKINGFVGIDITKILPQETLNEIIPGLEQMFQDIIQDYIKEAGGAATAEAKITEKNTDENGNFISIKAALSGNIDLTKLPANINSEDLLFTSFSASLAVDLKTGISFDVSIVSNPAYKGFNEGQEGLKEMLDKLIARDPATLQEIENMFKQLDQTAQDIVDGKFGQ